MIIGKITRYHSGSTARLKFTTLINHVVGTEIDQYYGSVARQTYADPGSYDPVTLPGTEFIIGIHKAAGHVLVFTYYAGYLNSVYDVTAGRVDNTMLLSDCYLISEMHPAETTTYYFPCNAGAVGITMGEDAGEMNLTFVGISDLTGLLVPIVTLAANYIVARDALLQAVVNATQIKDLSRHIDEYQEDLTEKFDDVKDRVVRIEGSTFSRYISR